MEYQYSYLRKGDFDLHFRFAIMPSYLQYLCSLKISNCTFYSQYEMINRIIKHKSMGECNTILSAYTLYRHLG